jgi:hypothetical protein
MSVKQKLYDWWKYDSIVHHFLVTRFVDPYYETKQGIKNIIKWFPVIWEDRDYDHDYIYSVLLFKLKKQRDYIAKREWHKDTVDEMSLVISELEKSREDYTSEAIKGHEAQWGEFKYELVKSEFADCSELVDTREKHMTEAEYADMQEDFRNRFRLSRIRYDRDRINAFTLLGKHIPNWWD